MAIEIIKKPTKEFTIECEKCECVLKYTFHDLLDSVTPYIICPCCSTRLSHLNRKKYTEVTK